jgi:hypothetical protein
LEKSFLYIRSSFFPPIVVNVDAPFDPGEFGSWSLDKLQNVRVIKVKVTHNSAILIHTTSAECFI